jgi:hypothetical protein
MLVAEWGTQSQLLFSQANVIAFHLTLKIKYTTLILLKEISDFLFEQ